MKNQIGCFVLMIACALIGAFLAVIGAKIAGLPESSWSLEPLAYLALGFGAGAFGFVILVGIIPHYSGISMIQRAAMAASGAVILAFVTGLAGYPISRHNAKMNLERSMAQSSASDQRYKEFYSRLSKNSEVSLRESWYRATDERLLAYRMSIQNRDVDYSASTLGQLYILDNQMAVQLLKHPSFDPSLLESEFHKALKRSLRGGSNCDKLQAILRNPNARDEWFAEVVSSGILDKGIFLCSESLRDIIARHLKDQESEQGAHGKPPEAPQLPH
jgi:hypothetical protein